MSARPRLVGQRIRRLRGDLFVTGRARYIDDLVRPGMLYAAVLRSPHPHARIRHVDARRARRAAGVRAVVAGEDVRALSGPIPFRHDPKTLGAKSADVYCLALDKVVFAGQPVAAVAATTPAAAERAAALVSVDYEILPHVLEAEDALRPAAPLLYDDWGDNVALAGSYREGDVDRALRTAAHTFRYEMRIGRSTSAPIETRGYIADWNVDDDTLTVYGACQNPHPMRWVLAQALRILESRVRVVAPNVGGAFGLKMHGHPEEVLLCVLSRLAGAPVKWIEDRRDCFLAGAREQTHRVEVAVHGDGRVAAFRDRFVANVGAMSATPGWGMALVTALTLPTGYRVPHCEIEYTVAVTNKAPWHPTRGYGKEAANLVMERVMDLAARTLGLDPAEVRRRNFIARDLFPYATPTGLNIDSGDYEGVLDKALALIDYPRARREQAALRGAGRLRGVGIAFELTPEAAALPGTLSGGFDASTVRMDPSGNVTVLTGVTSPGGGNETGIAQVVADELGVSVETVSVVQGDTASCPYGFGNSTGRSLVVGGSSAALAARDVKAKLAQVASGALGCDPGELVFAHGRAAVRDDRARSVTMREIAQTVYRRPYSAADMIEPLLEATRVYKPGNIRHTPDDRGRIQPYPTYSNAVHVAVVDVDGDTGQVTVRDYAVAHDCGVMINPTLVEAQMHGAVAMGIGAALFEASAYDRAGRLVSDRFKTYLLPRAGDLPALKVAHHVTPSPFTLLGNKGAGEAGVGGALAAVTNAVDDALAPLGVAVDRVPLRPPVVLALLDRARA